MRSKTITRVSRLRFLIASVALAAAVPMLATSAPREHAQTGASKPTAPISISHRLLRTPEVGQPVEVLLSITSEGEMSQVDLSFAADDPLAMLDPVDGVGFSELTTGEGADVAVTVLPLLDQTHYLNVTVTALIDGEMQTRSIAVPIRLPGSELRKAVVEPAGQTEERVRSFEAIETVR